MYDFNIFKDSHTKFWEKVLNFYRTPTIEYFTLTGVLQQRGKLTEIIAKATPKYPDINYKLYVAARHNLLYGIHGDIWPGVFYQIVLVQEQKAPTKEQKADRCSIMGQELAEANARAYLHTELRKKHHNTRQVMQTLREVHVGNMLRCIVDYDGIPIERERALKEFVSVQLMKSEMRVYQEEKHDKKIIEEFKNLHPKRNFAKARGTKRRELKARQGPLSKVIRKQGHHSNHRRVWRM